MERFERWFIHFYWINIVRQQPIKKNTSTYILTPRTSVRFLPKLCIHTYVKQQLRGIFHHVSVTSTTQLCDVLEESQLIDAHSRFKNPPTSAWDLYLFIFILHIHNIAVLIKMKQQKFHSQQSNSLVHWIMGVWIKLL